MFQDSKPLNFLFDSLLLLLKQTNSEKPKWYNSSSEGANKQVSINQVAKTLSELQQSRVKRVSSMLILSRRIKHPKNIEKCFHVKRHKRIYCHVAHKRLQHITQTLSTSSLLWSLSLRFSQSLEKFNSGLNFISFQK